MLGCAGLWVSRRPFTEHRTVAPLLSLGGQQFLEKIGATATLTLTLSALGIGGLKHSLVDFCQLDTQLQFLSITLGHSLIKPHALRLVSCSIFLAGPKGQLFISHFPSLPYSLTHLLTYLLTEKEILKSLGKTSKKNFDICQSRSDPPPQFYFLL